MLTALYGSETRTLNKKDETTPEALEVRCWRKMEKIKMDGNEDKRRSVRFGRREKNTAE